MGNQYEPTAGMATRKRQAVLDQVRKMIQESAAWTFPEADCLTMNMGSRSFSVQLYPQRNGVYLSTNVFSMMPRGPDDPRLEPVLVASLLYAGWTDRCSKLFGKEFVAQYGPDKGKTGYSWVNDSASKMVKAVEKVLQEDPTPRYHAQLDVLAANVRGKLRTAASPLDLYMADLIGPLKSAIAKGASREDLIRVVDEALVEGVMKA